MTLPKASKSPSRRASRFRVMFGEEHAGWMDMVIEHDGQRFETLLSYVPYDTMAQLASWLLGLWDGHTSTSRPVMWCSEPEEFEMDAFVVPDASDVRVQVARHRDSRRGIHAPVTVFETTVSRRDVCGAFWRAFRQVESSGRETRFEREWRWPTDAIARLGERIHAASTAAHKE